MIYDIFSFNGEYSILDLHLSALNPFVDKFIIVEAPTTFTGQNKPLYYEREKDRFKKWHNKIQYFVIDESYSEEEISTARESPNTNGASHWTHEFLQKESIKKAISNLNDNDLVFIGDVDEVWQLPDFVIDRPYKLKLRVYTYWLNNRSDEPFHGTVVAKYGQIKDKCLNHIRSHLSKKTEKYYGWHFTSMGGLEEMRRKLDNSYTQESYNTPFVQNNLEYNMFNSKDFLGRNFTYKLTEHEWPRYLKDNKEKYLHLMK